MDRFLQIVIITTVLIVFALAPCRSYAGEEVVSAGAGEKTAPVEEVMHVTLRASLMSPLFSEFPVAVVNGEKITIEELKNVVASSHEGNLEQQRKAPEVSFRAFLDRLITVRLFAQEARNVGLADVPEIKSAVENFSDKVLRQTYTVDLLKDVKENPDEAETIYKNSVREWKILSVVFLKEEDAKKTKTDMKNGMSFEKAIEQALRDGIAQGSDKANYIKATSLQPEVAQTISRMSVGSVSSIVATGEGKLRRYSLIKLEDVRYPDDPTVREVAKREALKIAKRDTLDKYTKDWSKKYVRINRKLLAGLDYESTKPGAEQYLEKLRKDQRAVAEIRGEKPVTVADLTAGITGAFYHGQESMKLKKANKDKERVLTDIITKRMLKREALTRRFDNTGEYKAAVSDYETTLLFNTFVAKVLIPEANVSEDAKKNYYREHLSEYTAPISMRLSGLAFQVVKDAENALEKLRKGASFNWMRENAGGQLGENTPGLLEWNGDVVVEDDLPANIRAALSGAKAGDFRLAVSPEGYYYVLSITEVTAPGAMPYEQVESIIAKQLFGAEIDRIANEWTEKLRQSSEITVYLVESRN